MASFILLLAAVVLIPLALAVVFPDATETVYCYIVTFRTAIGALLLVVTVPLFLSTGNPSLIAVAGFLAAYGIWKVLYDDSTGVGV